MILKYLLFRANLLNPVNVIQTNLNKNIKFFAFNSILVAMIIGCHFSRAVINKINPLGYYVNTSRVNKMAGLVETREILICIIVTIENPNRYMKIFIESSKNFLYKAL